jgi:site-specific DNA-cytosine methylase
MISYRVGGICSGIGGFELGLVYLNENNPDCWRVLARDFPGVIVSWDLQSVAKLPDGLDVLCMGIPCQPFSVRNIRRENAFDGTLSEASCLIKHACRLLANTLGSLAARDDGVPFQHLCCSLQGLGYTVAYRVVHAASWGLPQIRRRLIAVFRRYGDPCDDILATIPTCAGSGPCERSCYLYGTQQAGLPHAYCTDIGKDSAFTHIDICPTITASGASRLLAWVEGKGVMLLQSRQLLRLRGFFEDWLAGLGIIESAAVRMVGNSMPPPMSRWLGRAVGHHGQAKYTSAEANGL